MEIKKHSCDGIVPQAGTVICIVVRRGVLGNYVHAVRHELAGPIAAPVKCGAPVEISVPFAQT